MEAATITATHHIVGEAMATGQPNSPSTHNMPTQDHLARKGLPETYLEKRLRELKDSWLSQRGVSPETTPTSSVPPNTSQSAKTPEEAPQEARKQLMDKLKAENPFVSRYIALWESGKIGEPFEKFFAFLKEGRWTEYAGRLPSAASTTTERIVDKVKDWFSSFK
jgi:hypothetical protein